MGFLKFVRLFLPLGVVDRSIVGVLILVWGLHAGWDDYAVDQLRGMGARATQALEYYAGLFVRRNWPVSLPRMILTIIES